MKSTRLMNLLLTLIALLLGALLVRSFVTSPPIYAQSQGGAYPVYVEPGVKMLRAPDGSRQVLGKVIVDLRNGNVWGFPTTTDQPYPVDVMKQNPPTSRPFQLGRFDFSGMDPQQ